MYIEGEKVGNKDSKMQILKFYLRYKIISDFYNFQIFYNVDKNNGTQ